MFLYLTIYMQGVLDFSPLEAGLRFLPLTVLVLRRLADRRRALEPDPDSGPARRRARHWSGSGCC